MTTPGDGNPRVSAGLIPTVSLSVTAGRFRDPTTEGARRSMSCAQLLFPECLSEPQFVAPRRLPDGRFLPTGLRLTPLPPRVDARLRRWSRLPAVPMLAPPLTDAVPRSDPAWWRDGETWADFCRRLDGRRRPKDGSLPLYVKAAKGGSYQARPWVGPEKWHNVNLGLFTVARYGDRDQAIQAASRAAREFMRMYTRQPANAKDEWAVVKALKGLEHRYRRQPDGRMMWVAEPLRVGVGVPVVPGDVWPRFVRRDSAGRFWARSRKRAGRVELGPFETPEDAHAGMVKRLRGA